MNKSQIRQHILQQRLALSSLKVATCAERFKSQLLAHSAFTQSEHIAFYYPCQNELDVMPALRHAITIGKKCYLPYIKGTMQFVQIDQNTKFEEGKYQIPSPLIESNSNFISPKNLELVIMPTVAISENLYRIGMGKGYYDKTFSFTPKPKLIAACYSFQLNAKFTPDPWDVKCDDYII